MFLRNKSTIFFIILALLLVAGFVWYGQRPAPEAPPAVGTGTGGGQAAEDVENGLDGSTVDTNEWIEYRNEEFGFKFQYPKDIKMFDCTDTMSGSYIYFIMRYVDDDYNWCNAPGKAVPHSIYVELSQFMTRNDLTQTISMIEDKSIEFKKNTKDDSTYLEYTFNEKDDEGNVIEPKINIVNKRAFIMVRDDLYISVGLIYEEKEVNTELKQKYEFAINQIFESFIKID